MIYKGHSNDSMNLTTIIFLVNTPVIITSTMGSITAENKNPNTYNAIANDIILLHPNWPPT